ncbi:MAG: hypothetical protein CMH63_00970 [Nanoarchaeota archaeon]|nr:hypothetical protein [Nanoarchaeota archaeon]
MDKKGAIEFSMTTIMVIIIGVAVLSLGIAWVRGTFTQVGEITESALDTAETIFGEVGFTGRIGAPATIIMKTSDAKKYRVYVRNTKDTGNVALSMTATLRQPVNAVGDQVNCLTDAAPTTGSVTLEPGEQTEFGGGVIANGCPSGSSGVISIAVNDNQAGYATEAIAINIQ